MKILITGGAGFIGSNLVHRLCSNKENQIYILDNLCTGYLENIEDVIDNKNIHFINSDIRNTSLIEYIQKSKFDYIYNFASPASPKYYLKHPVETLETNILGIRNILMGIKGSSTRLLQASTSEVYGKAKEIPQKEEYWGNVNCTGVRACYDEGKRSAETLIFDYKRLYNVDAIVVRLFNTYGPRMNENDGRIISNFVNQAIKNENITIYGDGNQTRSFCYIDDTLDAILLLMMEKVNPQCPINIGNPIETKVIEVAQIIKKMTKSKSNIVYEKSMEDDPIRRKPDITEITKLLNWVPKVQLDDGLKRSIAYYQNKMLG
ncbi:MAG: GDP-mannose 4,6-dehydratase [Clostridia bacterium]|nr:GDP-mannose 4,6-dehydratase [Clostridia bacterium]